MVQETDFNSILREDALDIHLSPGDVVQAPNQRTDYVFDFSNEEVLQFQRIGDDLVILLNDGSSVRITGYYENTFENALVFLDPAAGGFGISPLLLAGGAVAGLSGLALAAGNGGANPFVTLNDDAGGSDGTINASERDNGLVLTGTAPAGATVSVTFRDITRDTIADNNGDWEVVFAATDIPAGENEVQVSVIAVDADGNQGSTTGSITVDTIVNTLTLDGVPGGTDEVVNLEESAQGVTISGDVEPGSSVIVLFEGIQYDAIVARNGHWSADIPPNAIPDSNGDTFSISVTATDAVGNTRTIADTFDIDTIAPDAPIVTTIRQTANGIDMVAAETPPEGTVDFFQVSDGGAVSNVTISEQNTSAPRGETDYTFASDIPSGSNLILSVQDAAGNIRSSYQVFDNGTVGSDVSISNTNLRDYNIDGINLIFADEADLTLTEDSIVALSREVDSVTIFGDSDDEVSFLGATRGATSTFNGDTFVEYSLGDSTAWIDSSIPVFI